MEHTLQDPIDAEAKAFAKRDTVVRRAYRKKNPNNSPEPSVEFEIKAAEALLSGPFFEQWFQKS